MPPAPDPLAAVPLFAGLEPGQRQLLLEQHRRLSVAADQLLVLEQDEAQGLLLFESGLAKVRSHSPDGDEAVLALLGPGDVCGEMAGLQDGRRSADVVSLVPCELLLLRGAPFRSLLLVEPRLALAVARLQSQRLQELNRRYTLRAADATTRLLTALVELAQHASLAGEALAPIPPLPQRELATLSGLARETTSRTLSRLRQRGIVADLPGGGLQIVQVEALRRRGLV
jgi:CRP-like cAMP-binding protein